jgi:2-amino-4-hydroxy-6-hydroxymethyldihydropteridine diphosphokinase
VTIYAIAIASNFNRLQYTQLAMRAIQQLGVCEFSPVYEIPCRDGIGADYWNCACLLESDCSVSAIEQFLKDLEMQTGRKRPSHDISLDVDLIAHGHDLQQMQFNPKKLPLAIDVVIPLADIWNWQQFKKIEHDFLIIDM